MTTPAGGNKNVTNRVNFSIEFNLIDDQQDSFMLTQKTKNSKQLNKITRQQVLALVSLCSSVDHNGRSVVHLGLWRTDRAIRSLRSLLFDLGCFDFYSTNSGDKLIGVSQIVYFLYFGYKALNNGWIALKGDHEIHHIDGDISNNHPSNLVMLSSHDHRQLSLAQQGQLLDFGHHLDCLYDSDSVLHTQFNRQGKTIKNHQAFIRFWLQATLIQSIDRWLFNASRRGVYIKTITDFCSEALNSINHLSDLASSLADHPNHLLGFYHTKLVNTISSAQ